MIKTIKSLFWCGCADFWARVGNLVMDNNALWAFTSRRAINALNRALFNAPISEDKQNELRAKIILLESMRSLWMKAKDYD